MSRLAPLDKALVQFLVPLWAACFSLGVWTQIQGGGVSALDVSIEDARSYPVLTRGSRSVGGLSALEEAGLRRGDLLVAVGAANLRGVGSVGVRARAREEAGSDLSVPVVFERSGERRETSLPLAPVSIFLPWLANSFAFAASAMFLLLRARPTPVVRAFFQGAFCIAFSSCFFFEGLLGAYLWTGMYLAATSLVFPLALRFGILFPDSRAPQGRGGLVWPWCFAVLGPLYAMDLMGRTSEVYTWSVIVLGAVAILTVATRNYHRGDPIARRQIKWALFGMYCALLPMIVVSTLAVFDSRFGPLWLTTAWALPIFPLSLLISIGRFNLFDIDRLLSATASYNILLVLLVSGGLVIVPRVAEAVSGLLRIDPGAAQVVLSLTLAAVLIPAHRRLRPQIDRVFFKERYALDRGIAELLPSVSHCRDARELTERVGEGLSRLLRPEACVVYGRVGESFVPVFAKGRAVPPGFSAAGPLAGTLSERRAPLVVGGAGRRPDEAPLGPFDRAVLETLDAEVVVPVWQDDALAAFLCLGPKRSGDVYTSTDLSLLAAVAETVSQQLQRFDQEKVAREAVAMQESLRRYVPGAIAEQLLSGSELAAAEREVSVLFVDIRGYTSFSESRRPKDIFSTVNRYTEMVSEIVRRYGGAVVEFNGDGMMAVFGAPRELAHKERAAVEAGREIAEAVGALMVNQGRGGPTKLSVGVGIATGEAFVGNIRAVDRMIWSAIGNTTNLAGRLQSLTRDLDAALVIDDDTWHRAQPAAADFEKRPDLRIRGRRGTQDVYALLMPPGP